MKVTIRKSIIMSLAMMVLLIIAIVILTFMRIDRKVIVPGSFTYRNISPVVIEESGFAEKILKKENDSVVKGDTILTLRNSDLEISILNSKHKIMINKLNLEEILQLKALDVSLSSFDLSKLKEQLKVKKEEETYYKSLTADKSDLYSKKIISKDEYEEANILLKQTGLEVRSIEIQINELDKQLQKLDASTFLKYKLKQKELEIEEENLKYLLIRDSLLTVRASIDGKLISRKLENELNSYFSKGDRIGEIVSFEMIDFTGYASGTDIIRVKEGQTVYFDVDTFRGKDFIEGKVRKIGLRTENAGGMITFPVEIEVMDPNFFDRSRKRFIHAGVTGQAIIITEEDLPILRILWEQIVKYADFN